VKAVRLLSTVDYAGHTVTVLMIKQLKCAITISGTLLRIPIIIISVSVATVLLAIAQQLP